MQLEVIKYCCAVTPRYSSNNTQNVTLSNTQEGKIQKWNRILILDYRYSAFQTPGPGV